MWQQQLVQKPVCILLRVYSNKIAKYKLQLVLHCIMYLELFHTTFILIYTKTGILIALIIYLYNCETTLYTLLYICIICGVSYTHNNIPIIVRTTIHNFVLALNLGTDLHNTFIYIFTSTVPIKFLRVHLNMSECIATWFIAKESTQDDRCRCGNNFNVPTARYCAGCPTVNVKHVWVYT